MWGIWSDLMEVWLSTNNVVFTTKQQSVAEGQILAMKYGRQLHMEAEARARQAGPQQSHIMTPSGVRIPGVGDVPIRGNARPASGVPPVPPDPQWRVRSFDAWWNEARVAKGKTVDLTG